MNHKADVFKLMGISSIDDRVTSYFQNARNCSSILFTQLCRDHIEKFSAWLRSSMPQRAP